MTRIREGQSLLVLGSGIAGLLYIHLARIAGATPILATDILESRIKAAHRFGADEAIHAGEDIPSLFRRMNHGRLADRVVVATGARKALEQALNSVERGGTILLFAPTDPGEKIEISINELFWRNDVTLTTSYAGSPADHVTALSLIEGGRVRVGEMITHRLGLEDAGRGFQLVESGKEAIKVILQPHGPDLSK
jgi:L-iditol 2-dehydrogenase